MAIISFKEFELLDFNPESISNYKLIDGQCVKCDKKFDYSQVKKFLRSRKTKPEKKILWQTCQKCWLKLQTCDNPEWVKKNSESQLIAQNKPEQKKANAEGVSRSWDAARKKSGSDILKKRWGDPEFAKKALSNLDWTGKNDKRFREIFVKSIGRGGLVGRYNGVDYDSALELSYLFWCEKNDIKVKRYDLLPVDYLDENSKPRKYIPDFIINEDTVIEIKGLGLYYKINYLRNICKLEALKKSFPKCQFILSTDPCLKENYKKARSWHHENQEKKNNPLQGKSE